jgi:hypothetical protein
MLRDDLDEFQGHLGLLKAKLAKLRTQLLEPTVSIAVLTVV